MISALQCSPKVQQKGYFQGKGKKQVSYIISDSVTSTSTVYKLALYIYIYIVIEVGRRSGVITRGVGSSTIQQIKNNTLS